MSGFERLSTCPTIPDQLRRDADRRAQRLLRALPVEVWCRPAVASVMWSHRNNGLVEWPTLDRPGRTQLSRATASGSQGELVRLDPSGLPLQGRSLALARARQVSKQGGPVLAGLDRRLLRLATSLCLLSASAVLVAARVAIRLGLLSQGGMHASLLFADRLTQQGMRMWHRSRALPDH